MKFHRSLARCCNLFVLLILLTGCNGNLLAPRDLPAETVKGFLGAFNAGKTDEAVGHICETIVLPNLPGLLYSYQVKTLSNDGSAAQVNVTGEIRLKTPLGTINKRLDFNLNLQMTNGRWCIQRASLGTFLESLVNLK